MSVNPQPAIAVIGAGPAGLMAAELLSAAGARVDVYERMPSVGRKLLMAGRGGLNLTHSEPVEAFVARYGPAAGRLAPLVRRFSPSDLTAWANGLGQPTFVGSSGRVFPKSFKASPLLRAWIGRLRAQGVAFHMRWTWRGWDAEGRLLFDDPEGRSQVVSADAAVLTLGGASWPRLGSDASWVGALQASGVDVAPFRPTNCGFDIAWSETFRERFAGQPLKNIRLTGAGVASRGDAMITAYGLEGGAVYAISAALRDEIEARGKARVEVDLRPDVPVQALAAKLARPRGGMSASNFLRKAAGLSPLEINIMRETAGAGLPTDPTALAGLIKGAPLELTGVQPIARAISSAGGVRLDEVDEHLMLRARPGVFVAGEMLDWEAPTGGYLLQATFATGRAAAEGVLAWSTRTLD